MSSDRTNPSQGPRRGTFKPLSDDVAQLYTMLNNQRRQLCILTVDRRCDPPHDLRPIAREVTARINETTLAQARGKEYQKVYVPLIQGHLDQLDEADILRYNEHLFGDSDTSPEYSLDEDHPMTNSWITSY